jgi:predicted RNA binding protein YcfA (HicA-like mRNA interferase family)
VGAACGPAQVRGDLRAVARQADLMPKKVKEVVAILEENGWTLARQSGSHRIYKHPERALLVTVSGRWNSTVPVGMLTSVRRTSGIEDLR